MHWSSLSHADRRPAPIAQHIGVVLHEFSTGGSERIALLLANEWAAAARHVTIFAGQEEGPVRALVDPRVGVVPIAPRMADGSRRALGRALAGMVQGIAPDVIVGPGNHHLPILAAMLAALPARRPAVVCKLSNPLRRPDRGMIRQAWAEARTRRHTRGFDRLVAMDPALAAEARAILPGCAIIDIAEPILESAAPPPPRAAAAAGPVLCIGRLVPQKNIALGLEAIALSRGPRRLLILGEGEDYGALRDRAEALGIADRVRFVGYVADVRPYLALASALLCTSRYEGYPAALVEALAAGVPVVTTPCSPALPAIMADRSFGRVAPPDARALADALDDVLDAGLRPAPTPLAALVARHQRIDAAHHWLVELDAAVAARAQRPRAPAFFAPAWPGVPAQLSA